MNKAIVTLTAILTTGAIYAADDAQFYEMDITIKTTKTRSGSVDMISCDCRTDESGLYRKQGSVKIKGAIWGCGCGTLTKGEKFTSTDAPFGYFFWNVTDKKPLNVTLSWPIANRIDKKANKTEVVWVLTSDDENLPFHLVGSGFGTLKDTVTKDPCMLQTSRFVSIKGSCAGWMAPDAVVTTKATEGECNWCKKVEGTPAVTAVAKGWAICSDCSAVESGNTGSAAYGTWKIKYNTSVSAKLENDKNVSVITDVYSFPSYVKSVME